MTTVEVLKKLRGEMELRRKIDALYARDTGGETAAAYRMSAAAFATSRALIDAEIKRLEES